MSVYTRSLISLCHCRWIAWLIAGPAARPSPLLSTPSDNIMKLQVLALLAVVAIAGAAAHKGCFRESSQRKVRSGGKGAMVDDG